MKVKLIATALALAVLAVLAGRVTAQETNTLERTFMTFSAPVEMPGVTLEAGTYVFKLADTGSRNVVEVWDKDSKHMIGHWTFVREFCVVDAIGPILGRRASISSARPTTATHSVNGRESLPIGGQQTCPPMVSRIAR